MEENIYNTITETVENGKNVITMTRIDGIEELNIYDNFDDSYECCELMKKWYSIDISERYKSLRESVQSEVDKRVEYMKSHMFGKFYKMTIYDRKNEHWTSDEVYILPYGHNYHNYHLFALVGETQSVYDAGVRDVSISVGGYGETAPLSGLFTNKVRFVETSVDDVLNECKDAVAYAVRYRINKLQKQ